MSSQYNWYGVKIIYRITVEGEPTRIDRYFKKDYVAYEESIVVFNATSFDEAYSMAEVHSKDNEDEYINYYGQKVVTSTLGLVDCFLMNDDVDLGSENGVEVYSNLIESTTSMNPEMFLKEYYKISEKPAYMLLNIEFSQPRPTDGG